MRRRRFSELSYAAPNDPALKRWIIRAVEGLSGRDHYLDLYEIWRKQCVGQSQSIMGDLLNLLSVDIKKHASSWPPTHVPDDPLVIISNHPFGIGDGMAALALAEELGRPFKVLIHNELMKIPEIEPYALPIDFRNTREALKLNLATRKRAHELLKQGVIIIVFPAGGVATAKRPFGKAEDLPWKLFPARLIQTAEATVLPLFFSGQNGPLFHLVSQFSMTLRLSLLIREFRRFAQSEVHLHVGDFVPFSKLSPFKERQMLTDELHRLVHSLADGKSADHR